ncbi:MAG TPA: hypothetical protein VFJ96_05915 [Gemmatimonadaceae bacterium]|nr:hypothetical protein [Gemmatimonadaceae bacterium]
MPFRRCSSLLCAMLLLAVPTLVSAQRIGGTAQKDTVAVHREPMMMDMSSDTMSMSAAIVLPLGIPMTRLGSGTSWQPDAAPMHTYMFSAGAWAFMAMGEAYLQYDRQGSARGDDQFGSVNWGMLMAGHELAGGQLLLRGMLSLEPWTVTRRGYPLLLQSGESFGGGALHDRQHPHDLFMELAASYDRALTRTLSLEIYAGAAGEPALGPVAFPHRASAMSDPLAPLSHHWQDATHVTFGVATVGVYTRRVKLEGSIFNGREPDENRTNFDLRRLDSYSGRVTVNPNDRWSVSASYGFLASPEALHPEVSVHRITASVANEHPLGALGEWSSTLVYGGNAESDETHVSNSVLGETNVNIDGTNIVFARLELVQKSARDLAISEGPLPAIVPGAPSETTYDIGSFVLGYARELATFGGASLALGARGSVDVIPETLQPAYGTRTPAGFTVFLRIAPRAMHAGARSALQYE